MRSKVPRFLLDVEEDLLSQRGHSNLDEIFRDIAQNDIRPGHIDPLDEIFTALSENASSLIVGYKYLNNVRFEGDKLAGETEYYYRTFGLVPLKGANPENEDNHLVVNTYTIQKGVAAAISRIMPVMVRSAHLEQRIRERQTRVWRFDNDATLFPTMCLSVMMARLFEEIHDWEENNHPRPFVLPAKDGLYRGFVSPVSNAWLANRFLFSGVADPDAFILNTYQWLPFVRSNIFTYLGKNQLSPNETKLMNQLQYFLRPDVKDSLSLEIDSYTNTRNEDLYTHDRRRPDYERAFLKLADIVESDLWKKTVKMPVGLQFKDHSGRHLGM